MARAEMAERARIESLFADIAWPSERPVLQVLDAAGSSALQNLAAAGMIRSTPARRARCCRTTKRACRARIDALHALAAKKRRAAAALRSEELTEEAEAQEQGAASAEREVNGIR